MAAACLGVVVLLLPGEALACCCYGRPHPPACFVAVCTGSDGWDFEPAESGAACTVSGQTGSCDGMGSCLTQQTATPKFVLLTILYNPPGKQGSVSYGTGSTTGNSYTHQFTSGTGGGVGGTVSLGVPMAASANFSGSATWTYSTISGTVASVRKVSSYTLTLSNNNPPTDNPDHGVDSLRLWTNPQEILTISGGTVAGITWQTSDGQPITERAFTVNELQGLANVPDFNLTFFQSLTPGDISNLLAQDPFAGSSNPTLNPIRFQKVDHITMTGPDNPGDPIPSGTYSAAYNRENDTINGSSVNAMATETSGLSISLFGVLTIGGSSTTTVTEQHLDTRQAISGNQQTASVTVRTPTVCFIMEMDVFIDASFSTYLLVPTSSHNCATTPLKTGTVYDSGGHPLVNKAIKVTNPNGTTQQVYTDATGTYRVYSQ